MEMQSTDHRVVMGSVLGDERSVPGIGVPAIVAATLIVAAGFALLYGSNVRSKAEEVFRADNLGKCFSTALGAVGKAVAIRGPDANVIFPTGSRDWYAMGTLSRTDCPSFIHATK